MNTPIRYLSVCSGMEAASVAWEPLGFKAVGFSEIEPFPCAILKHRFPNTPNYGSLTEYQSWPIEQGTVDLLVGGTPCQSFSVAGLRKGLEDPRGNLALTFLGLADKLRPRWIVWENVPGVLSSNGGRDLGSFLGALGQLGYGWAYRILDAQHFGVPQRRRRVFVVATSTGDGRLAGAVLSLPEGLRGYLASRQQKRKGVASDAGAGSEADGPVLWNGSDQPNAERLIDKAGTLNCNKGQRGGYICPAKPVVIDQDTVGTLCARDYKGVGNQYVQEGKCIPCEAPIPIQDGREIEKRQNGLGIGQPGDPAYTIDTTGAQAAGVVAIQGTIIGRGENAGPQGVGATEGGPMFTLTKTDIHGVAVTMGDVAGPLDANYHKGQGSRQGGEREFVATPFREAKRAQSTTDDESWVEGEVSNTLNNFDLGDTRTTHAVVEPLAFDGYNQTLSETSQTIRADKSDGDHVGMVIQPTPAPLMFKVRGGVEANDGSQGGEVGKTAGKGFLGSEDKAFTLAATQDQWLAEPVISPTVTTCKGSRGGCSQEAIDKITAIHQAQQQADLSTEATTTPGDQMPHVAYSFDSLASNSMKSSNPISGCREVDLAKTIDTTNPCPSKNQGGIGIVQHMAVRRLTPVECERLQGFPDNWSRIPWKGKPEEDCPDGPRYKACGNSMAVPVMRWIGKRIQEVEGKAE